MTATVLLFYHSKFSNYMLTIRYMYVTPTFMTKTLHLATNVQKLK